MNCPACKHEPVTTTRTVQDGALTVRARSCPQCGCKFTTHEKVHHIAKPGAISSPPAARPQATGSPNLARPAPALSSSGSGSSLSLPLPDPFVASGSSEGESDGAKALVPTTRAVAKGALFDWALTAFRTAWAAVYSEGYVASAGDRSQLGRMLGTMKAEGVDPSELPELFHRYVNDPDKWVAETQRHSLLWFCTRGNGLNKYRTRARTEGYSEKEIRGAKAVMEFAGGGNGRR